MVFASRRPCLKIEVSFFSFEIIICFKSDSFINCSRALKILFDVTLIDSELFNHENNILGYFPRYAKSCGLFNIQSHSYDQSPHQSLLKISAKLHFYIFNCTQGSASGTGSPGSRSPYPGNLGPGLIFKSGTGPGFKFKICGIWD